MAGHWRRYSLTDQQFEELMKDLQAMATDIKKIQQQLQGDTPKLVYGSAGIPEAKGD